MLYILANTTAVLIGSLYGAVTAGLASRLAWAGRGCAPLRHLGTALGTLALIALILLAWPCLSASSFLDGMPQIAWTAFALPFAIALPLGRWQARTTALSWWPAVCWLYLEALLFGLAALGALMLVASFPHPAGGVPSPAWDAAFARYRAFASYTVLGADLTLLGAYLLLALWQPWTHRPSGARGGDSPSRA